MLLPSLTVEQLRERVKEAEALLRVARQHARDAHDNPEQSEHASARIQSICREVEGLFPGLHEPSAADPELQATIAALQAEIPAAQAARIAAGEGKEEEETDEEGTAEAEEDAEEEENGEEEEDDDEEDEWDIDYAKLASAIENETLMSAFPEPGRTAFKRAAQYLIESHERHELFGRVVAGFEGVSELAQQNVDDMRKKLAMALTLEGLANKRKG